MIIIGDVRGGCWEKKPNANVHKADGLTMLKPMCLHSSYFSLVQTRRGKSCIKTSYKPYVLSGISLQNFENAAGNLNC